MSGYTLRMSPCVVDKMYLDGLDETLVQNAVAASERPDTLTVCLAKAAEPVACVVIGKDTADMVAVYFAKAYVGGIGPLMMKQLFGAAQVVGAPIRVHVRSVERLRAYAKMVGANVALEGRDAEGVLQGIFAHV